MSMQGGCYCGELRYVTAGEPGFKAQCHCRECQYISGGSPNVVMGMPTQGFAYTKGTPKAFSRGDLPKPVSREFCGNCGTHILTRAPGFPGVILKVGTLDDPSLFGGPEIVVQTADKQPFHLIPVGVPIFERFPG